MYKRNLVIPAVPFVIPAKAGIHTDCAIGVDSFGKLRTGSSASPQDDRCVAKRQRIQKEGSVCIYLVHILWALTRWVAPLCVLTLLGCGPGYVKDVWWKTEKPTFEGAKASIGSLSNSVLTQVFTNTTIINVTNLNAPCEGKSFVSEISTMTQEMSTEDLDFMYISVRVDFEITGSDGTPETLGVIYYVPVRLYLIIEKLGVEKKDQIAQLIYYFGIPLSIQIRDFMFAKGAFISLAPTFYWANWLYMHDYFAQEYTEIIEKMRALIPGYDAVKVILEGIELTPQEQRVLALYLIPQDQWLRATALRTVVVAGCGSMILSFEFAPSRSFIGTVMRVREEGEENELPCEPVNIPKQYLQAGAPAGTFTLFNTSYFVAQTGSTPDFTRMGFWWDCNYAELCFRNPPGQPTPSPTPTFVPHPTPGDGGGGGRDGTPIVVYMARGPILWVPVIGGAPVVTATPTPTVIDTTPNVSLGIPGAHVEQDMLFCPQRLPKDECTDFIEEFREECCVLPDV